MKKLKPSNWSELVEEIIDQLKQENDFISLVNILKDEKKFSELFQVLDDQNNLNIMKISYLTKWFRSANRNARRPQVAMAGLCQPAGHLAHECFRPC